MKKHAAPDAQVEISRRKALAKLGLAVGVTYAAPIVLRLEREAQAGLMGVTPCPPPNGNPNDNPPGCTP